MQSYITKSFQPGYIHLIIFIDSLLALPALHLLKLSDNFRPVIRVGGPATVAEVVNIPCNRPALLNPVVPGQKVTWIAYKRPLVGVGVRVGISLPVGYHHLDTLDHIRLG